MLRLSSYISSYLITQAKRMLRIIWMPQFSWNWHQLSSDLSWISINDNFSLASLYFYIHKQKLYMNLGWQFAYFSVLADFLILCRINPYNISHIIEVMFSSENYLLDYQYEVRTVFVQYCYQFGLLLCSLHTLAIVICLIWVTQYNPEPCNNYIQECLNLTSLLKWLV